MKQSTTLLALISLIVAIVWGCSSDSNPAPGTSGNGTPTASNTTTNTGSTLTGTTGATTAGMTTGGVSCVAPQVDCGGVCIDTSINASNCGGCGVMCPTGQSCTAGMCGCPGGAMDCGGVCADIQSDANNCGGCGMACASGQLCQSAACSCQAGLTDCAGTCINTNSNVSNCGGCGMACVSPQVCSLGACSDTCAEGLENCDGSCVDLQTEATDCGSCGNACPGGTACVAGACECPEGQEDCGAGCVDTQASNANCGACGNPCPTGASCTAGACACPAGQELCAGGCVAEGSCEASECGGKANSLMISDFEGDPTAALDVSGETGEFTGLWEGFGDDAGTQTTAVEAVTDAECGTQALHATGSNFQSYVGIGFSLAGDPMAPDVYTNPDAWTGIRFKAKKGAGQLTPVRFNIATPATEGVGSGGSCDDSVEGHDCYNHPGRFLEGSAEIGTSWRTYHFCFDRDLYPQFLPSAMTNAQRANVGSNILKMQFIFNKAIDPNVADIDNDPNGGEYPIATPFDLWIDDVEFTKDPCPENLFEGTGAKPFPQNQAPGSCALAPNVEAFNTALSEYYVEWKERYLQPDGGVFSPEDNRVISEGIGYGMLLAVSFGDQAAFDSMWGYASDRLEGGLMRWTDGGSGSATDGDADIAYALLLAGDQWGGSYAATGMSMISAMGADITGSGGGPTPRINPGSNYGDTATYNPSYFTPAYYSEFGGDWGSSILTNGYTVLQSCNSGFINANNGLVPDWCDATNGNALDGNSVAQVTSTLCQPGDCKHYAFDAARVPWRIGVDACLNGRAEASAYLEQLIGHFVGLHTAERIDQMRSGYRFSDGMPHANSAEMQASFIGPVGVGAMAVNQTAYQRAFRTVLDTQRSLRFNRTYYPATVGLLSLMEMSGNIPHR